MQQYTEQELMDIASQRETKNKVIQAICGNAKPASQKLGIFMAGSPGAGKTESAQNILGDMRKLQTEDGNDTVIADIIHLEQDKIKSMMDGYTGKNAPLYQKPASRLLASVYKYVLNNNLSFIHDTTFSHQEIAEQNITQAIKKGYIIRLYFVYQDPQNAWHMVQQREKQEGRIVPAESFVEQFIHSQEVVNNIKSKFGNEIHLNIIIKNIDKETGNAIEKFFINKEKIDNYIGKKYSKNEILSLIE